MFNATDHAAPGNAPHPATGQTTASPGVPAVAEYVPNKPETIPLNKVYVRVGRDKIYFGRGNTKDGSEGPLKKGGLYREKLPRDEFGPQRDPTLRLDWIQDRAANFKQHLFDEASHVALDEDGEFDDIDGGGRALIAHIKGFPTIEAFVIRNLSKKARAQRFREHQFSRTPLGAVQEFLAKVAEGCQTEVAIYNAIRPMYIVAKNGTDAINSVNALRDVYGPNGEYVDLLRRTAQVCATAWKPKYENLKGGRKKVTKKGYHVPGVAFVAVALVLASLPEKYDEKVLRGILTDTKFKTTDKDTGAAKVIFGPTALIGIAESELFKLANKSKADIKERAKLLTQLKAVPTARVIARMYNDKRDSDAFPSEIDIGRIDEHPIAVQFSKLR